MMMAVSFERYGRLYYLDPGAYTPGIGDKVLVPTDSGPEVAECVWAPQWVSEEIGGLPVCAGLATDDDLARDEENRRRRAEGRLAARRLVREHQLPMKVTAVDYIGPENVFIVYFSAPHRVDFRALVRDLGGRLKARVELRQIGPRDEARLQGGIGPCGRDLCCATFLKDFEPVSVRMAKDQDLPVNPLRIAGACGRLMCCLKYEHPLYQDFRKDAPPVGSTVTTAEGPGTVVGHNVPSDTVVVKLSADGRAQRLPQGQRVRVTEGLRGDARQAADRAGRIKLCAGRSGRLVAVVLALAALLGPARARPRRGAQHAGRLLRAAPGLAALRRRFRVRPARRALRLRQAGRPAVHPAGGQAAGRRPGAPGRRAGHQPRRAGRVRRAVRARRPPGVPRRGAGPVRHRRLRPARRRRQPARAELRERPAA